MRPRRSLWSLALVLCLATPAQAQLASDDWRVSTASTERARQAAFWRGATSFVLPGTGQLLNHEDSKGWRHLATAVGLAAIPIAVAIWPYSFGTRGNDEQRLAGALVWPFYVANIGFHLYSALDAYQVKTEVRPSGALF